MYRLALFVFAAFALIVVSGCNEQTPTANSIQSEQSLLKPPVASGIVFRAEGFEDFVVFRDGDLVIVIGRSPNWPCDASVQEFDLQILTSPSNENDERLIGRLSADDAFVEIFEIEPSPICDILASPRVASGNVKVRYNDNDVVGAFVHNNANAVNITVNGKVIGADEKNYNLNASYHLTWDGEDGTKFNRNSKIQLIPTGKK